MTPEALFRFDNYPQPRCPSSKPRKARNPGHEGGDGTNGAPNSNGIGGKREADVTAGGLFAARRTEVANEASVPDAYLRAFQAARRV